MIHSDRPVLMNEIIQTFITHGKRLPSNLQRLEYGNIYRIFFSQQYVDSENWNETDSNDVHAAFQDSMKYVNYPNDVKLKEYFYNWGQDPYERWLSDTFSGIIIMPSVSYYQPSAQYLLNIDFYSATKLPYKELKEQYNSALTMKKLAE